MCGIVGILNLDNSLVDKNLLYRMSEILRHRGPDDEGYFIDKNIGLGHKRLSIIDLQTGRQPIFNEDKSIVVVYNGEIYNFKEIKENLIKKGHRFITRSDTEVIVHSYEEYGENCVKIFNGMFAFCIWDKNKKRLFLARDRLGIKPLYYYLDNIRLVFSSEIKAILEDTTIKRELDQYTLIDYVTFQNILDEKTLFKGITKLLPGHYLTYENNLRIKRYWDVEFKPTEFNSFSECTERFREIFKDAVKRHLISDVPLGCYLSGGFDSTSVSTIASHLINSRLETFTGTFDEGPRYTEVPYSRAVASKIGAKIHEVVIRAKDFIDNIYDIVYHLDEPTVGTGSFPQYLVSKLVSEHVKVVLTGHGGDELFCGYEVFKACYYKDLIKKNPLNILKFLSGVNTNELARIMYFFFYPFFQRAVQYGLFIMFDENDRKNLFTKEFYSHIKDYNPLCTIEKLLKDKELTHVERVNYLYLKTYLPALFIVEDKVGMAHSIEARTPICDNELVSFALSLPIKHKLYNNKLKAIIKEGMRGELPKILYGQPKKGFPTPFSIWFRNELKQFSYDILLGDKAKGRGIFNTRYIKGLLDRHCNLKTNTLYDYARANKIFSLMTIEIWFRRFIDSNSF